MAEEYNCEGDLDVTCFGNIGFPRGRGTWLIDGPESGVFNDSVGRGVERPQVNADNGRGIGISQTLGGTPVGRVPGEGPYTSTPGVDRVAFDHLTDMVGQLGSHIGESIVAKLVSAGLVNVNAESQNNAPSYTQTPARTEQCTHTLMTPQVTAQTAHIRRADVGP